MPGVLALICVCVGVWAGNAIWVLLAVAVSGLIAAFVVHDHLDARKSPPHETTNAMMAVLGGTAALVAWLWTGLPKDLLLIERARHELDVRLVSGNDGNMFSANLSEYPRESDDDVRQFSVSLDLRVSNDGYRRHTPRFRGYEVTLQQRDGQPVTGGLVRVSLSDPLDTRPDVPQCGADVSSRLHVLWVNPNSGPRHAELGGQPCVNSAAADADLPVLRLHRTSAADPLPLPDENAEWYGHGELFTESVAFRLTIPRTSRLELHARVVLDYCEEGGDGDAVSCPSGAHRWRMSTTRWLFPADHSPNGFLADDWKQSDDAPPRAAEPNAPGPLPASAPH